MDPIQPLVVALGPVAHTRRRLDTLAQQNLTQAMVAEPHIFELGAERAR